MREVHGYLELTGYYRPFVHQYGAMAASLTQLLKNGAFKWIKRAREAFVKLKNAMMTLSVLALLDFNLPFEIEIDASRYGIGAVWIQAKRPIAYYSHTLALRDRAKPVYERELVVVVLAVQRWRPYLLGTKFVVKTDRRSIKLLLEPWVIQPQYQKWIAKLLGCSFEDMYKPALKNKAANALSRMPPTVHLCNLSAPTIIDLKIIKEEVENDSKLKKIIEELGSQEEQAEGKFSMQQGILRSMFLKAH